MDEDNILVKHINSFSAVKSPSSSPLEGKILFPDANPTHTKSSLVISRLEQVESRLDTLDNQINLLQADYSTIKQTVHHNQQNQLKFQQMVTQRFSEVDQKLDQLSTQLALVLL